MHRDFPQWGFSVYFVAYCDRDAIPESQDERWAFCMSCPACVELTHNHGSEGAAERYVYNTGNSDATGSADGEKVKGGFGHLGITVPDVYAACERFHARGVEFHKSPNAGRWDMTPSAARGGGGSIRSREPRARCALCGLSRARHLHPRRAPSVRPSGRRAVMPTHAPQLI